MSEEQKQAELAAEQAKAEAEAQDAEFEASIAELSDDEKEAKRAEKKASLSNKGIDYAKIAEEEKQKRLKAEKALADKAFKDRQARRSNGEEDEEEDPDKKPLSRSEVLELIQNQTPSSDVVSKKDFLESQANLIAEKFAGSKEEQKAIIETWKNRKFPSDLSLDEQMDECYAIVNRKKLIGERNEALRAIKGRDNASKDSSTTHHDSPRGSEPQVASDVKGVLSEKGFVFNQQSRRYEKKLSNGKLLIRDPKTGRIYPEGTRQAPTGA